MQAPFTDPLLRLEQLRTSLPIVGRDAELQLMQVLLDTVALDLPTGARAVTISGEMGVGKTRLLAALCHVAGERGFRILEAHCYASGSLFPYFPFIEVLRPILRSSSPELLRRYLGLRALATFPVDSKQAPAEPPTFVSLSMTMALALLFPELPILLDIEHSPEPGFTEFLSPELEKFRLLDAIATLLERMASEQPLLLAIDNLQWADSASLELMLYLVMRLRSSRIALVGVTRAPAIRSAQGDEAAGVQAITRMLADLMRQGMLQYLLLGPLSMQAAAQHLQTLLPGTIPPGVAQPLLSRAEGNPFFLEELVRTLMLNQHLWQRDGIWQSARASSTRLPDSIILAVKQRIQGLSTPCREFLDIAALFGRTFPLEALTQVLQMNIDTIQPLVDEAMQASVIARFSEQAWNIDESAQGYDLESSDAVLSRHEGLSMPPLYAQRVPIQRYIFCQGIVQEAFHADIPAYRARPFHAAIGTALEACYAHEAADHAAELAHHYAFGGEKEATLHWSLLAGEDAARKHTHREAISHFRLVVKLLETDDEHSLAASAFVPPLAELYLTIGELWFRLGELAQAVNAFQQALQHLQYLQGSPLFLVVRANRLLADAYRMQTRYDQALAHLQAAATAFNAILSTSDAAASESILPIYASWFPGRSFTDTMVSTLKQERISTTEHILFLQSEAVLKVMLNRSPEAETALWQSHQLATEIGDRNSQAFALYWLGWIRGWGEQIQEAIRFLDQAIDLYISIGDLFRATIGDQVLGSIYQTLGDLEHARLYTLRGLERARRYGILHHAPWFQWNQGVMALMQGDWENCVLHLQQALQGASVTNDARLNPLVLQVQGILQFRRGNWQVAEQHFLDSIQSATALEWFPGSVALYGHFLAVTGRLEAARVQLERASQAPEPPGFNGHYYIPFLVEGYIHLNELERAAAYIERLRKLRGFIYYGVSVERILGILAMHTGDWQAAERAFEDGLVVCRRANNHPEEAAILYEQARAALMHEAPMTRILELCDRAHAIFLQYTMQRAVAMVDALREGVKQLDERPRQLRALQNGAASSTPQKPGSSPDPMLDLRLTKREREVLRLVAEGHTDREVAEVLIISPRTANRHLSNIFVKLDVPGRAAAVAYAIRHGLV